MVRDKKWSWASTDGLQTRILDAALATFQLHGYCDATMEDIRSAADVSSGSIYHHFGGKDDLFYACFRRLQTELGKAAGLEPGDDMIPGEWEGAFLRAAWENRDACAVFLSWDGPPSFQPVSSITEFFNGTGPKTARILSAIMLEAIQIITDEDREEDVRGLIDNTVRILNVVRAAGF